MHDVQGGTDETKWNGNDVDLAYHLQDSQYLGRLINRESQWQQHIHQDGRDHVHQLVDNLALNDQVVPLVAGSLRKPFEHIQKNIAASIVDADRYGNDQQQDDRIVQFICRTADNPPFDQMIVNPFLYCVHILKWLVKYTCDNLEFVYKTN